MAQGNRVLHQERLRHSEVRRLVWGIKRRRPGAFEQLVGHPVKQRQILRAARIAGVPPASIERQLFLQIAGGRKTPPSMQANAAQAAHQVLEKKGPAKRRAEKRRVAETYVANWKPPITRDVPVMEREEAWNKIFALLRKKLRERNPEKEGKTKRVGFGRLEPNEKREIKLEILRLWLEGVSEEKIATAFGWKHHQDVQQIIGKIIKGIKKSPELIAAVRELYEK